jgi:YHS domain-containing protein
MAIDLVCKMEVEESTAAATSEHHSHKIRVREKK